MRFNTRMFHFRNLRGDLFWFSPDGYAHRFWKQNRQDSGTVVSDVTCIFLDASAAAAVAHAQKTRQYVSIGFTADDELEICSVPGLLRLAVAGGGDVSVIISDPTNGNTMGMSVATLLTQPGLIPFLQWYENNNFVQPVSLLADRVEKIIKTDGELVAEGFPATYIFQNKARCMPVLAV